MSYKVLEPIEMMLEGVTWVPVTPQPRDFATHGADDGIPYATHEGILDLFGIEMRCFRLSDGKAVIDAESVEKLFGLFA